MEGKLEDGTVFLSSPVEEFDYMLGQGAHCVHSLYPHLRISISAQAPKGLEIATCAMKVCC